MPPRALAGFAVLCCVKRAAEPRSLHILIDRGKGTAFRRASDCSDRAWHYKHLKSHPVEHNVHITAAGSVEFRRTIIYLTQSLRPLLGANVCPGGKGGEGHVFGAGGPAKPWWAKCWNFAVGCGKCRTASAVVSLGHVYSVLLESATPLYASGVQERSVGSCLLVVLLPPSERTASIAK